MAKLQVHPLGLGVVIFGLIVWIIALGGLGASTYKCQQQESYTVCAKQYQWEWWNLWFEVALLLALFITCFLEQAFKRGRICFLAFFVLATQGCMWSAHNFLTQLEITAGGLDVRDLGQDAINAGAAGFLLLSLVNFILLIVLGKDVGFEATNNPYQQAKASGIQFQTSAPV